MVERKGAKCAAEQGRFIRIRLLSRKIFAKISKYFGKISGSIKNREFFHNAESGIVLILFLAALPVIFLGTKYVLDKRAADQVQIEQSKGTVTYYKRCAREAALAVAKNWNPGLNLTYQKDALLKIADAVYNAQPCYRYNNSGVGVIGTAIPGLDEKKSPVATQVGSKFNPLQVIYNQIVEHSSAMAASEIKYTTQTKYTGYAYGHYHYWNTLNSLWRAIDVGTNPANRISAFDEIDEATSTSTQFFLKHHDIFIQPKQRHNGYQESDDTYPNDTRSTGSTNACSEDFWVQVPSTVNAVNATNKYHPQNVLTSSATYKYDSVTSSTYKVRSNASDSRVQISVDSDRIKVTTDASTGYPGTTGYAQPAQCNVDIVLAVPVNGAACNTSNNDAASATAGTPFSESCSNTISATAKTTPIYQMGQACKNFVKDNFYHTKGVTMGLIPYSAKVSIAPSKATSYTIAIPKFVEYTPLTNPYHVTAAMYGTSGVKDAPLVQGYKTKALTSGETLPTTDTPYYWGGMLTGCPIMCRRGSTTSWYSTQTAYGNLLSNVQPSSGAQYKYMRMNLNPCLAGFANQLSMKCERKCTHFLPNPFYMIEPTADMVKIYEMCNALYPIYDTRNVSNFLFIPFEWANNFWQSWTNNVTASASTTQLSVPNKTTSGRKKVLVMLVNKPDWFEPGEMTYLGFDNDYSAVPLAESDKIDFSIDYSDTSKKFLDGTAYDGTPRGPKKIIRYATQSGTISRNNTTGDFECTGSGTGRLYIPRKAMVRLTVKNIGGSDGTGEITWEAKTTNLSNCGGTGSMYVYGHIGVGPVNGEEKLLIITNYQNGTLAYSSDGINWTQISQQLISISSSGGWVTGPAYGNGKWVIKSFSHGYAAVSTDGINWIGYSSGFTNNDATSILFANGRFYTMTSSTSYVSTDGSNWSSLSSVPTYFNVANLNGIYYAVKFGGTVYKSTDNGSSWNQLSNVNGIPSDCYAITTVGEYLYSTGRSTQKVFRSRDGINWETVTTSAGTSDNITYYKGKLYLFPRSSTVYIGTFAGGIDGVPGTIKFTNIGNTTTYTIRDEKTFTIPAANIDPNTVNGEYYVEFNVSNLKLISAEVTNLSYTYVQPINTSYNEVEMIGPGGSSANMSWGTRSETVTHGYIYQTSGQSSCSNNSNFFVSRGSGLQNYDSTYGWYPSDSYRNTQTSVTIYSDTNDAMTLYCSSYTPSVITGYTNSGSSGSVTFYDTNGVTENVGTYALTAARTFTFNGYSSVSSSSYTAGPNFGSNYGINKINYSISNATLTAYIPGHGQLLRYWSGGVDPGLVVRNSGSVRTSYMSGTDDDMSFIVMGVWDCHFAWNFTPSSSSATIYLYYSYMTDSNNRSVTTDYYGNSFGTASCSTLSSYKTQVTNGEAGVTYTTDNTNLYGHGSPYPVVLWAKTPPSYFYCYRLFAWACHDISWGGMNRSDSDINNNQCVTANGSWIKFNGDSTCVVTVTPNTTQTPVYATYNTPYVKIPSNTSGSYNTNNLSTSHGSSYSYTIPSSAFTWDCANQRYYTTVYFYNASLRYIYQPNGTKSYPALLANASYSVTYSYNNCSGTRVTTTGTTSSYDSSLGKYYINLPRSSTPKFAARKYSVTEAVYDMIDYSSNSTSSKNGCLSSSFSMSYTYNFYTVGSSSTTGTLTTNKKGRLELKVAPSFASTTDSGYIKMNYGSDQVAKTITTPMTLSMKFSDLSNKTMQFTLYNVVILYAKFHSEAEIGAPNYQFSQRLMWNTSSVSTSGTNISLSGTYSNWSADECWHRLTNNNFIAWNSAYVSDITAVLDAKSPICAYWNMPEYAYGDAVTNFVGAVRLYSQTKRSSARKYCQMYAYNSSYNDKANLLWHNFTLPCNHVLYRAGYQTAGGDATAAVRSATAAVCAKLKTDYGSNLRVYVVKYRKQAQYKTFPNYNTTQTNADHTYTVIDKCATDTGGVAYDVSSEADLKTTLNTIAGLIKSFAGYTAARNVD